jgi:hypothetical protein
MFVGHFGVGLALKRADTAISLGVLFLATQFADIIWPIFVALGIEKFTIIPNFTATSVFQFQYYPLSHSLLTMLGWALLGFLLVAYLPLGIKGNKILAGAIVALGIFSHYLLDAIVHVPDLPLMPGEGPKIGLGLWNYYWPSILLEFVFLIGGLWIYLSATKGNTFAGKYGLVILAAFLAVMQVLSTLSVPPNNPKMIAISALATNLLVAGIAFWLDRKRTPRNILQPIERSPLVIKKH